MISKKLLDKILCYYCGTRVTEPYPRWKKRPCCRKCWDKFDRDAGNPYAD